MGATLRGRDATRPVPSGSFRIIRIGDISQDGTLLKDDFLRIEPGQSVSGEQLLRSGDVLFPNRGIRTTAFVYRLDGPPTIVGAQFFVLRPEIERVFPEYLAWFLRTEDIANYFAGRRKGTYVQIIERKDLAELELPLPPLKVQHKIVAAAELAVAERKLSERLASLNWKFTNEKLARRAQGQPDLVSRIQNDEYETY
jgi:restriction endonuclease S subunit